MYNLDHPSVAVDNKSLSPLDTNYHYGDSISLGGHEDELDMNGKKKDIYIFYFIYMLIYNTLFRFIQF